MEEVIKNLVERIDVRGTLLSIPVGQSRHIPVTMIKAASIRSAVRILRKEGYSFDVTEKGLMETTKVTRIK
jgi:hypothetical protein